MEPKRSLGFCMLATDAQSLKLRGSRGQMKPSPNSTMERPQASLGVAGNLSILDITK